MPRRYRRIGSPSNSATGNDRETVLIESSSAALRRLVRKPAAARATCPGSERPRRTNSPTAGVKNVSGTNGCSPGSDLSSARHICAVLSPLARLAARNAPADTPTNRSQRLRAPSPSASSSARRAPISQTAPSGPPPARARATRTRERRLGAAPARATDQSDLRLVRADLRAAGRRVALPAADFALAAFPVAALRVAGRAAAERDRPGAPALASTSAVSSSIRRVSRLISL